MDFKDFNPDCYVEPSELDVWLNAIGGNLWAPIADEWFPGNPNRYVIVDMLRLYLRKKRQAMVARLAGDIAQAVVWEDVCDRLYLNLPKEVRW